MRKEVIYEQKSSKKPKNNPKKPKTESAAAKAANADSANENFAKVIEGQERLVTFTGKAGYKYRIVYQALDYHGKIASGRYYVQF